MNTRPTDATSPLNYRRRRSSRVNIGDTPLGSDFDIRIQSMTSTSTMDTEASVAQAARIIDAGADYVRLTAQGVREADNLANIRAKLRARGYHTPLVADIHFNPKAAEAAAAVVEKVRINPGNFIDPGRTFRKIEYTDDEYAREVARIEERLMPLIDICRAHSTAIRVGVNHGSLSDRIMSRYGDTPEGIVESAMEFLRVFVKHGFTDVVISIKASNTGVMVHSVRLLVKAMDAEGMHFPLHLGVTEAGNGEDGRVKSAVGIGTLLNQGIGDTIRVSLSEDPECEIPVAHMLVDRLSDFANAPAIEGDYYPGFDPVNPQRRRSREVAGVGGSALPASLAADSIPESSIHYIDADAARADIIAEARNHADSVLVLTTSHPNQSASLMAAMHTLTAAGIDNPIIPRVRYTGLDADHVTIAASADLGTILLNGFTDGVSIQSDVLTPDEAAHLELAILQAARLRMSHTEYISCPGCGRTLFDLQTTVNDIKAATSHLPNLKIGVMGCIVNGPGEMADADYGYVGAGVGHVSLYKGHVCVEKNIPSEQALPRLIQMLKDEGKWVEPQQ